MLVQYAKQHLLPAAFITNEDIILVNNVHNTKTNNSKCKKGLDFRLRSAKKSRRNRDGVRKSTNVLAMCCCCCNEWNCRLTV